MTFGITWMHLWSVDSLDSQELVSLSFSQSLYVKYVYTSIQLSLKTFPEQVHRHFNEQNLALEVIPSILMMLDVLGLSPS